MAIFLFLHDTCNFSIYLLSLIEKYWKHNDFKIIMVNEVGPDDIPEYVTSTPTFLILDEKTKETELFVGQNAYDWLYEAIVGLYQNTNVSISGGKSKKTFAAAAPELKDTKDFESVKTSDEISELFEARMKEYSLNE